MLKNCAGCSKTVYPVEKLNCLDKTWHKACFKCTTCGLVLSMKTYKGYAKMPYCNTHYPDTKFTAVADTPENLRLKKNTEKQSNIVYHKEFEAQKGSKITVVDDPETLRNKKVQSSVSQLAYTGHSKEGASGDRSSYQSTGARKSQDYGPSPYSARTAAATTVYDSQHGGAAVPSGRRVGSITDYNPMGDDGAGGPISPVAAPPAQVVMPPPPAPVAAPPAPVPAPAPAAPAQPSWIALYDYVAADDDEVSFMEGDIIVNGEIIDEGWMTGTVQRTGKHGMLPSNYVEQS